MKPLEHLLVAGAAVVVMACGCAFYNHKLQSELRVLNSQVDEAQTEVREQTAKPETAQVEQTRQYLHAVIEGNEVYKAFVPMRNAQSNLFVFLSRYAWDRVQFDGGGNGKVYGPRAQAARARCRKVVGVTQVTPFAGGLEIKLR